MENKGVRILKTGACLALLPLSILSAEPKCTGLERDDGSFVLKIENQEVEIPVISLGAKVKRCNKWESFPDLWVAEIDLGEAGTNSLRKETDLFVFASKGGKLRKIYQKNIETSVMSSDPRTGDLRTEKSKHSYDLLVSAKGDPQVRLNGGEPIDLVR